MATNRERFPYAYVCGEQDPRLRERITPMEVISAGYSRTGTMTMKAALEILGFPTWHSVDSMANPPDVDMWSDGMLAKFDPPAAAAKGIKPFTRKEFDNLLGYWGACTDQPACLLLEELLDAYPNVKVVLVERDIEKWYKSFETAVIDGIFNPFIPIARWLDHDFMKRVCHQTDILMRYYFNVTEPRQHILTNNPKALRQFRANARDTYRKHNEMVRRVVPADRLLVFQLEQGWEPLCKFLGKEIPDAPFPRVNETKALQDLVKVYVANSYKRALRKFAKRAVPVLVVVGAVVGWYYRG